MPSHAQEISIVLPHVGSWGNGVLVSRISYAEAIQVQGLSVCVLPSWLVVDISILPCPGLRIGLLFHLGLCNVIATSLLSQSCGFSLDLVVC